MSSRDSLVDKLAIAEDSPVDILDGRAELSSMEESHTFCAADTLASAAFWRLARCLFARSRLMAKSPASDTCSAPFATDISSSIFLTLFSVSFEINWPTG